MDEFVHATLEKGLFFGFREGFGQKHLLAKRRE
jgi:hypothetical protein